MVQEHLIRLLNIGTNVDFQEVVRWQVECGGKRIRPALTLLFAKAVGKKSEQDPSILAAAAGIELIHNFSLIFDDIIDQGNIRRGKKTTRAEFGDEMAILAGIQHRESIYHAARATGSKYYPRVSQIFSESISQMAEGERLDILFEQKKRSYDYFVTHQYNQVTEEEYLNMVWGKTGSLIRASCLLGTVVGDGTEEQIQAAGEYGTTLGYAFQIMDDYLDLFADERLGKTIGKDILERKLGNLVLIKALQNLDEQKQRALLDTIRGDLSDSERVTKAMNLINEGDGARLAKESANIYATKARKALEASFPDSQTRQTLGSLADYVVSRLF